MPVSNTYANAGASCNNGSTPSRPIIGVVCRQTLTNRLSSWKMPKCWPRSAGWRRPSWIRLSRNYDNSVLPERVCLMGDAATPYKPALPRP